MKNRFVKKIFTSAIMLGALSFIQSCSSLSSSKNALAMAQKTKTDSVPAYINFDQRKYSSDVAVVKNMIVTVKPHMDENKQSIIAVQISKAVKKYKIAPQIVVAIIDTESDFREDIISATGDVSIAQINVEVWNKELQRMKRPLLIKDKIIKDQEYAVLKMVEILNIIKNRYGKSDRRWYARYHSNTHRYKKEYLHRLDKRMKTLAHSKRLISLQIASATN